MTTDTKTTWRTARLGDFASVNPPVSLERGKEYPFMDMANVAPLSRTSHWQERKAFTGSGARFEEGDTLFARITPCLENGKITQAVRIGGPGFGSTEFYVLRGKKKVSDNDFIFYLTRTYRIRKLAEASMLGASGRQRVERAAFENIEVVVPEDVNEQKRIAGVLAAFDEKIENNKHIIKALEEMAQAIFKEWFVKFPFTGLGKVEFIDSPLGRIPKGWETSNLFDALSVTYGYPFKSSLFNDEGRGVPVIRIRNILESKTSTSTTEAVVDKKYLVEDGDILVGMDGIFHLQIWTAGQALLNQRVVRFRPKDNKGWFFVYLALQTPIKQKTSSAVGTTVAHLSDKDLKSVDILVPDQKIKDKFDEFADIHYKHIVNLQNENQKLAAMRDLLLPRLMSGEIRV